jgi:hypothetical protein
MSLKRWTVSVSVVAALVGLTVWGCTGVSVPASGAGGDSASGQTLYSQRCASCHPSASSLKSVSGLITNNLGSVSSRMNGITLTDQQVLDLQAYLASL